MQASRTLGARPDPFSNADAAIAPRSSKGISVEGARTADYSSAFSAQESTSRGGERLNATIGESSSIAGSGRRPIGKVSSVSGLANSNSNSNTNSSRADEVENIKSISAKVASLRVGGGGKAQAGDQDSTGVVSSAYMKDVARLSIGANGSIGGQKFGNDVKRNEITSSVASNNQINNNNSKAVHSDIPARVSRAAPKTSSSITFGGGGDDAGDSIYKTSSNSYGSFYRK
jgi:hypothetical protein